MAALARYASYSVSVCWPGVGKKLFKIQFVYSVATKLCIYALKQDLALAYARSNKIQISM